MNDLFDDLFRSFLGADHVRNYYRPQAQAFPHYNVRKVDNDYVVEVALAGYGPDDITIDEVNHELVIESAGSSEKDDDNNVLYKGVAKRSFRLTFGLGEYLEVTDARMDNGMLYVLVKRDVPEPEKRRISVQPVAALEHRSEDTS